MLNTSKHIQLCDLYFSRTVPFWFFFFFWHICSTHYLIYIMTRGISHDPLILTNPNAIKHISRCTSTQLLRRWQEKQRDRKGVNFMFFTADPKLKCCEIVWVSDSLLEKKKPTNPNIWSWKVIKRCQYSFPLCRTNEWITTFKHQKL